MPDIKGFCEKYFVLLRKFSRIFLKRLKIWKKLWKKNSSNAFNSNSIGESKNSLFSAENLI